MSRRSGFLLGALAVLLLGLLGLYLLSIAEPYQKTVTHGPTPEARLNPFLAAAQFLQHQGLSVRHSASLGSLNTLPSEGQTLLLLGDRRQMSPTQAERLLQWAAQGGHLLFVAEQLWDEDEGASGDLLLDSLGLQKLSSEDLDSAQAQADADQDMAEVEDAQALAPSTADSGEQVSAADEPAESGVPEPDSYPALTKLYLENEQAPAYFDFDTGYHLYDAQNRAHAWANSAAATHLLQLYHGDGLVTVLSDHGLWTTDTIDAYDHAWLLWYLSQDSAVTLLHNTERNGLGSLLLQYFPQALVAMALLIALSLWHLGQRQGPLQTPASRARRQLEEHLRASADFMLRHGGQQSLLQGLQQDIQRRARRRHPGFERLGVAEQWQVLGRLTRQPTSAIGQAMRPTTQRLSASQFTRQVAHLQSLRNAL